MMMNLYGGVVRICAEEENTLMSLSMSAKRQPLVLAAASPFRHFYLFTQLKPLNSFDF